MTSVTLEVSRLRQPLVDHLTRRLELDADDARLAVEHLLRSEQAGKSSHGLIRLAYTTTSGKFGPYGGRRAPEPQRLGPGRLHVDGTGHFGYALLHRLIQAGCDEAIAHGQCVATGGAVYPSGALGDWARMAADRGVGVLLTANSPRRVAGPGGRLPVIGTNALCVGLPADPLPFVADCSTSEIPHGALLVARASGASLPAHSAVDSDGSETTDAARVDPTKGLGALLPFGGSHKAFAVGMAIELLASLGGGRPGEIDAGKHGVFCTFLGPALLAERRATLSTWLQAQDAAGTRVPGWHSGRRALEFQRRGLVEVSRKTLDALRAAGALLEGIEPARAAGPECGDGDLQ